MLRITGGAWRGRRLATPPGDATRPSMDMHRQSLFNILGQDLSGERVLDLFAGSGAFALESLSRGAARAVMVERGRAGLDAIRRNLREIAPPPGAAELVDADCYALPPLGGPFDLVFIAPPYPHFREERMRLDRLVASLAAGPAPLLAERGLAIVQSDAGDFPGEGVPGLEVADRRRWGRTEFTFLRRTPAAATR
jgi:16S rRNA (guanine(966)-N(2))-methyltransferase RsmD